MPNADSILARKDRPAVVTVDIDATVVEAAHLMNLRRIGALVVTREDAVVGIFTERDVLRRIVARERDPVTTRVRDVMTTPVACATRSTSTAEMSARQNIIGVVNRRRRQWKKE